MYDVTLKKVNGGTQIRTATVTGRCSKYPVVGESFTMYADPIDLLTDVRIITTSIVKSVTKQEDGMLVETLNSIYHLTIKVRFSR